MKKPEDSMLTYQEIIAVLEEELKLYAYGEFCEELNFDDPD